MNKSLSNYSKNKTPTVSVVMSVLNGEKYLAKAIQSILDQSFKDFEFIIINDGSTDQTEKIIKSFNDPRIIYIDNGKNLGLAKSFNIGIDRAKGEYIARMDADDISRRDRFIKQFSFLVRKPHVGIVGSSIIVINENEKELYIHRKSNDHKIIKFSSLFSTPMHHPTIMGRSEIFKNHHFNEILSNSEDYELWSRLLFNTNIKFANIREPLLRYRVYPKSFTQTLNLDKRSFSAHNTIKNIENYLKLHSKEKDFIMRLRQESNLSFIESFIGIALYFKTTLAFINKESLGIKDILLVWKKYFSFIISLFKHQIKKLIRI